MRFLSPTTFGLELEALSVRFVAFLSFEEQIDNYIDFFWNFELLQAKNKNVSRKYETSRFLTRKKRRIGKCQYNIRNFLNSH